MLLYLHDQVLKDFRIKTSVKSQENHFWHIVLILPKNSLVFLKYFALQILKNMRKLLECMVLKYLSFAPEKLQQTLQWKNISLLISELSLQNIIYLSLILWSGFVQRSFSVQYLMLKNALKY